MVYSLLWYPIIESKSLCSVTLVVLIFQFLHYMLYRLLWLVHIPLHIHSPLLQYNHSRHCFNHHPRKFPPLYNIWTSAVIEDHIFGKSFNSINNVLTLWQDIISPVNKLITSNTLCKISNVRRCTTPSVLVIFVFLISFMCCLSVTPKAHIAIFCINHWFSR